MMTTESMLSKRPVLRITSALVFLLKLFFHINCVSNTIIFCFCCFPIYAVVEKLLFFSFLFQRKLYHQPHLVVHHDRVKTDNNASIRRTKTSELRKLRQREVSKNVGETNGRSGKVKTRKIYLN